jgi:ATP-binding cassette, subfamily F, member 3
VRQPLAPPPPLPLSPRATLQFPDPGALGIPVLQISDVTFGYRADKPLFRGVNFSIDMTSRIALVGPNGVGKSTLLKLILGELEPQSGTVNRNSKLRMACFTQHHINQLDLTATPVDFLLRVFPGSKPDAVRAHLGSFGLGGDLSLQTIGTMSGGQKSRVAFSVLTWKKPHVLILDEPSNNLDIETIDAVIVALANFTGGVIVVSHDQHFVDSVCDEIYVMGGQRVGRFKGEFKEYRKVAESEKAFKVEGGPGLAGGGGGGGSHGGGGGARRPAAGGAGAAEDE